MTKKADTVADADSTGAASPGSVGADHEVALEDRVVAFFLEGQRYALPIDRVQEIQQIVALSEVPGGGRGIVGMINLRGQVIPAVDLRQMVGLPAREYTLETPMIICMIAGQLVALIVDEVEDVLEVPSDSLQPAPPMHALASKLLGVGRLSNGLVYVVDAEALLDTTLAGGW